MGGILSSARQHVRSKRYPSRSAHYTVRATMRQQPSSHRDQHFKNINKSRHLRFGWKNPHMSKFLLLLFSLDRSIHELFYFQLLLCLLTVL